MKKEEKLKDLLKRYFHGKLTHEETENLFYLINDEALKETAFCELYNLWESDPENIKAAAPEKIFGNIKQSLHFDENKSRQDDLILKGLEYTGMKSSQKFLNVFIRYAAIVIFAVVITFFINYLRERAGAKEIARHEITAPNGSRIKILLSDSTEVWLNSGSRINYAEHFTSAGRDVYLEGEAYFKVRNNESSPFFIRTSDLNIKVLGTSLNIKSYTDENFVETSLITGQVEITEINPKGIIMKPTLLYPEQKALYNKETGKMRIEHTRVLSHKTSETQKKDEFVGKEGQLKKAVNPDIAWKDNKFVFNNEVFSSLAIRLERWYNVEIEVKDDELSEYKFTGIFEDETIEQAMYAFKIASSMEYKFEKNKISVWKSNK